MNRAIHVSITPLARFLLWLALACWCGDVRADQAAPDSSRTLFRRVVLLSVVEGQTAYRLPDRFIVYHTDRIELNGQRLVRAIDYWIDYDSGIITLARALPPDAVLLAHYERFPAPLQRRYAHRRLVIEKTLPDSLPAPPEPFRGASQTSGANPFGAFPSTLRAGGSKTFSILTGSNRNASLEQSLRIQISGKAARDVEVLAILSDQNSPIQPEGNTQKLQELDNVLVQVKTPHVTTTMGDYDMTLNATTFARYDRKLKGVQGEVTLPNGSFQIAAAVSEGQYTSNAFQGVEGNQGPYPLTDDNGNDAIAVIAGTEKVWVDGVRMTRGEDNDYTIDYAAAQITFTRHRLITGESRIVVDFEAADRQFQRNLYAARGTFDVGDRMTIGATFIREGDDHNNPASVSLSSEDITALKTLDGKAEQATVAGAEFVGEGDGEYILRHDETYNTDYFEYVGPNNGTHRVTFSQVGFGEGDYIPGEHGGFQYAGPDQGNYVPQVFLPLPTSHALAGFDVAATPYEGLTLSGELAVSNRNPNTFAEGANKRTLAGSAFLLNARFVPQPLRLGGRAFGRLEAAGTYRSVQNAFRPVGRIDGVEYDRRYNQGQTESWRGDVMEMNIAHRLGGVMMVGGGFGRFERPDGFSSRRRDVRLAVTPHGLPHLNYRYEIIRSTTPQTSLNLTGVPPPASPLDTRWVRQKASVTHDVWHLRSWASFETERRSQRVDGELDGGRNYTEVTAGVTTLDRRHFSVSTGFAYRTTETVDPGPGGTRAWFDESVDHTIRHRMALRDWRALSASAQIIHRRKTFKQAAGETNRENLIDSQIRFSPWRQAIAVDARYEVTHTQSAQTARRYVLVGRGQGDLRLDPDSGEFVPDPDGEYIVRFDRVGDFAPVTGVRSSLRLQTAPYRHLKTASGLFNPLLTNIRTDTYFTVDERTRAKDKSALYLLRLSEFQQDSTTVSGQMTFRQDVFLFPQHRRVSVRLRYERNSTMNNQLITGGERRFQDARSIRVRAPVATRTTGELVVSHENKRRTDLGRERFRIRSYNGEFSVAHRPTQPLELLLKLNAVRDHDALSGVRAALIGVAPRVTYAFRGRGRAQFEIDWASVRATPSQAFLPFEMARGRRTGESVRWRGGIDYQVSRYVSLFMQYDGRFDPGRPVIHTARMEMRALL